MKNLLLAFAFIAFISTTTNASTTIIKTSSEVEFCEDGKKCDKKDCKHNKKDCKTSKKECSKAEKKGSCDKKDKKACCDKSKAKSCDKSKSKKESK